MSSAVSRAAIKGSKRRSQTHRLSHGHAQKRRIGLKDKRMEDQYNTTLNKQVDEMASPHYSLRWNNHQSHLLNAFDSLLQNETLVDVTLVCEETSFKAHKVVLSACSPYFQRIFSETPCKHPVIVLKDLRGWEVQAIVDFMYRGEISVVQEQLSSLIKAAESLQVRGLAHTERIPMCPSEKENQNPAPCFSPAAGVGLFSQPPPPPPVLPPFEPPPPPLRLPQLPHMPHISFSDVHRHCSSPLPRRKQARPRRRSGDACGAQDLSKCPTSPMETEMAENLSMKKPGNSHQNNTSNNNNNNNNSTSNNNNSNNNHTLPPNMPSSTPTPPSHLNPMKLESEDSDAADSSQNQPVELTTTSADHRASADYTNSSEPFSLPPPHHIGLQDPLESPFPHLASISALSLTPPHMFSLDSHLGLFPGMESCRNSLLNDIPEVRNENHHISVKKKRGPKYDVVSAVGRPKGQHSAPRGGPPRSWTNAELTEALQHVWNKKMTTSQASRIFGIPYNSLLMYVRGKYGKSLKLEQLKKECFGDLGGPLDLLGLGPLASNNNNPSKPHKGPEPDLMLGPPGFNPSQYPPPSFYPDFGPPFPVPVGMVHLLPQSEKNREPPGPIDYAKEDLNSARNDINPIEYTKDDSNIRNSPMPLDFAKDDSIMHHSSSLKEEDDDDCRKSPSPRHHDDLQAASQQQNGQD